MKFSLENDFGVNHD